MKVGKVVGAIWATRKAACLQGQTFLVVESNGERIVAADQVGAGTGDKVLLATGTVASKYCMDAPVDPPSWPSWTKSSNVRIPEKYRFRDIP